MDWSRAIDAYCERVDASLLAEPANALTNCAFLLAALAVARIRPPTRELPWEQRGQPVLIVAVGLGSLAFHTLANAWTSLLDTVFIALYIHVWLGSFMARIMDWRGRVVAVALIGYLIFGRLLGSVLSHTGIGALMQGSGAYLPALLALSLAAWSVSTRAPALARRLGLAALVFSASLVARTLDLSLCPQWPLGTHFLWHVLNAWVLYLTSTALWHPQARSTGLVERPDPRR